MHFFRHALDDRLKGKWVYTTDRFTAIQIVGALSFPFSLIGLTLNSIGWHFHQEILDGRITWWMKLKLLPFFIAPIILKGWTMALAIYTCSTLGDTCGTLITIALILTVSAYHLILHKTVGYDWQDAVTGTLYNIAARAKPCQNNKEELNAFTRVQKYFYIESIMTSIMCYGASAILFWLKQDDNKWQIYSSITSYFAIFNLVVSQAYLKSGVLFVAKDSQSSVGRHPKKNACSYKFQHTVKSILVTISCTGLVAFSFGAHKLLTPGTLGIVYGG